MDRYAFNLRKLLEKRRSPEGTGWGIYTGEDVIFTANLDQPGVEVINPEQLQELIYQDCKVFIERFAESELNANVFDFNLYIEPYYGDIIFYIKTRHPVHGYQDQEIMSTDDDLSDRLREIMVAYNAISLEEVTAHLNLTAPTFSIF